MTLVERLRSTDIALIDACDILEQLADRIEDLEAELKFEEQRIADLMADINRVGLENDMLKARLAAIEAQEPLGEPFSSILHEHRWELYARDVMDTNKIGELE